MIPNNASCAHRSRSAAPDAGGVSSAYQPFHAGSTSNHLLAQAQCVAREPQPTVGAADDAVAA